MTPLKQMVFEVLQGMVDLGTTGTDRANKETLQLLTINILSSGAQNDSSNYLWLNYVTCMENNLGIIRHELVLLQAVVVV